MAQTQQADTTSKVRKNYLTYPYQFYAGQHARVFFGHVWVDDIITIQYSLNNNKTPIYGYASEQFDAIARGQVLVNGNFTIAFKETGYLSLVHRELEGLKARDKVSKNEILRYWLGKNKPVEQIMDELYTRSESDSDFEDFAESLEDFVWGSIDTGKKGIQILRPDHFDYKQDENGTNIDIEGFDIVLLFGDYLDDAAEHTVKVINDVHITSESVVITPDGSPIGINYNFFARGTDERISKTFKIPTPKTVDRKQTDEDIADRLDQAVATNIIVTIREAFDNTAEKINEMIGQDPFSFFKKYNANTEILSAVSNYNLNDPRQVLLARTFVKERMNDILNGIDFNTFNNGKFSNIATIKFDVEFDTGTEGLFGLEDSFANEEIDPGGFGIPDDSFATDTSSYSTAKGSSSAGATKLPDRPRN